MDPLILFEAIDNNDSRMIHDAFQCNTEEQFLRYCLQKNEDGVSLYIYAAEHGDIFIMSFFHHIEYTDENFREECLITAAGFAIRNDQFDDLIYLIERKKVSINNNLLSIAILFNNLRLVKYLINPDIILEKENCINAIMTSYTNRNGPGDSEQIFDLVQCVTQNAIKQRLTFQQLCYLYLKYRKNENELPNIIASNLQNWYLKNRYYLIYL